LSCKIQRRLEIKALIESINRSTSDKESIEKLEKLLNLNETEKENMIVYNNLLKKKNNGSIIEKEKEIFDKLKKDFEIK
jgi:hypothetical protein